MSISTPIGFWTSAVGFAAILAAIFVVQGHKNQRLGKPFLAEWRQTLTASAVLIVLALFLTGVVLLVILPTQWLFAHAPMVAIAAAGLFYLTAYSWLGHPGLLRKKN
jgi:hypothetical protein